jgi:hypothetical protein
VFRTSHQLGGIGGIFGFLNLPTSAALVLPVHKNFIAKVTPKTEPRE